VFSDNVLLGGGFSLERFGTHPHNIYFEVLMSSGIIGFLLFIVPLLAVFYFLFLFTRKDKQWAFLLVLYSQNVVASFFSTSIVTAAWLSLSIGLVLAHLKLSKNH
jgi:O-antigen ligase